MHKRIMAAVAATATALATAAGCESGGLSMRESGANTQSNYLASMYGGDALARMAATQPDARRGFAGPAVLAVAQVGETSAPLPMLDALRKQPSLFARVESVPALGNAGPYRQQYGGVDASDEAIRRQIDALRGLSSAVGADYLLLMGGTCDTSSGSTPLSVFNLTIVGMFIVPSERAQATMKASGALIDVRTGQLVALRSAELTRERLLPYASAESDGVRLLGRMRGEVSADLAARIVEACRGDVAEGATARR